MSDAPPDYAIGQVDLKSCEPNRGSIVGPAGLYWPYGLGFVAGWLYVADTGNRRVLGWKGLPSCDRAADIILGQTDACTREENRGSSPNARSFRWPHAIAGTGDVVYVADAGNHRVLGWSPLPEGDTDAGVVLGQRDFSLSGEFPHLKQGASRLRFPYSVARDGDVLAVADTANNRRAAVAGLGAIGRVPASGRSARPAGFRFHR